MASESSPAYARYYNEIRTHQSLDKDAPVTRPVQRIGVIISRAVLGGLHHHYARVRFSVHTIYVIDKFRPVEMLNEFTDSR